MARTPKTIADTSDEAKRLVIVYQESVKAGICKNTIEFCALIGVDQGNYSKMVNGKKPLNYIVIKSVCYKLGYSPAWFFNGEGKRKTDREDVKLVTEIQMLRSEIDIMANQLRRMQARMKSYEEKK